MFVSEQNIKTLNDQKFLVHYLNLTAIKSKVKQILTLKNPIPIIFSKSVLEVRFSSSITVKSNCWNIFDIEYRSKSAFGLSG